MFEHFDAHERIESVVKMGWDVSVVHQMNSNKSFQTGSFNPLFCESFLFNR